MNDRTNTITETSKLTVKQLGNPLRAAVENKEVMLGTIIGRATGTKVKLDSKGDAHEAILGSFEGVSTDGQTTVRAAMLYLPGGLHESIVEKLKAMNGAAAEFAVEIYSVPAKNAAGYSYAMRSAIPMAESSDPLAALRAAAGLSKPAALPAPEAATDPAPTPEPAPATAGAEAKPKK